MWGSPQRHRMPRRWPTRLDTAFYIAVATVTPPKRHLGTGGKGHLAGREKPNLDLAVLADGDEPFQAGQAVPERSRLMERLGWRRGRGLRMHDIDTEVIAA